MPAAHECTPCGKAYTTSRALVKHAQSLAHCNVVGGTATLYKCRFCTTCGPFDREDSRARHENFVHLGLRRTASRSTRASSASSSSAASGSATAPTASPRPIRPKPAIAARYPHNPVYNGNIVVDNNAEGAGINHCDDDLEDRIASLVQEQSRWRGVSQATCAIDEGEGGEVEDVDEIMGEPDSPSIAASESFGSCDAEVLLSSPLRSPSFEEFSQSVSRCDGSSTSVADDGSVGLARGGQGDIVAGYEGWMGVHPTESPRWNAGFVGGASSKSGGRQQRSKRVAFGHPADSYGHAGRRAGLDPQPRDPPCS